MKGFIFTSFVEMVEDHYGLVMADRVIVDANLPFKGHYTAIGSYDHSQLTRLALSLSKIVKMPADDVFARHGEHIFRTFVKKYPGFFNKKDDVFSFLERIDSVIHPNILKRYPDALLPRFDIRRKGRVMTMIYHSPRKMAHFARGMILGCLKHFRENASIEMNYIRKDGTVVEFVIAK